MSTINPSPDNNPDPFRIQIILSTDENTHQMIFLEPFEDAIILRKQDLRLGVQLTYSDLEGAIAVLDWVVRAGITHVEAEHASDQLKSIKLGLEGK